MEESAWVDALAALPEADVEGWLRSRRERITLEGLEALKAHAESRSAQGDQKAALRLLERGMLAAEIRAVPRMAALIWRGFANVYVRHARYEDCLRASERAALLYSRHGTPFDVAVARLVAVYALGALERFDEAVTLGHAVREGLIEEESELARLGLAHVAANLGAVHTQAWQFDAARRELETARRRYADLNLPGQVAWVLHDLALLELQAGHLQRADAHFEAAEAGLRASEHRLVLIRLKFNRADAYAQFGKYHPTLAILAQAREMIAASPGPLDEERGYVDYIEARAREALNERSTAIDLYRRALAMFETQNSTMDIALIGLDLGRCLLGGPTPDQQHAGFEALARTKRLVEQAEAPLLQAQVRLDVAECRLRQGWLGDAEADAQRARAAFLSAGLELRAAQASLVLADATRRLKPELAQRRYDEARAAVNDVLPLAARAWAGLARLAEQQRNPPKAEAAYTKAIEHLEEMQRDLRQHDQRALFFEGQRSVTASFLALLHRQPGRERDLLRWVERGKARALVGLLVGQQIDVGSDPQLRELWERREHARAQQDRLLSELTLDAAGAFSTWKAQGEAWVRRDRRNTLAALRDEIRRLDEQIARYQEPAVRWREGHPISCERIHSLLDERTAMVMYYETTNGLNALTLTHVLGDLQTHTLPLSVRDVAKHARRARRLLAHPQSATSSVLSEMTTLWQALIAPLEARLRHKTRVIILPHRELFHIPFAALYDPHRAQYLVERWAVQIAPSATVLERCRQFPRATGPSLLVGYPGDPAHPATYLPGVKREAQTVHAVLPEAEVLLDDEATVEHVLQAAPGRACVLLAGHALYADPPLESGVALANQRWLRATDLYVRHGHLRGATVVLSGCEAGRGRATGDDVLGLNSAFLYAGAAGTIAGLWRVHDAATADLIRAFFTAWRHGADSVAALRTAQRELLHDPRYGHPYTWAAFQAFGAATEGKRSGSGAFQGLPKHP